MKTQSAKNEKKYLLLYFQVHQPRRLSPYPFFDIGSGGPYFDDELNASLIRSIGHNSYLPANLLLLGLIHNYPSLRITFSISGIALEQLEHYAPAVLESFRMLASTGAVEFLSETYFHSLASVHQTEEFARQVKKHSRKINELLGVRPTVFRNSELIYSDQLGEKVRQLGFRGVFLEGAGQVLQGKSPAHLYTHPEHDDFFLFPRHARLSDDIAFRFADRQWGENPLTAGQYLGWLKAMPARNTLINLGMDYETFGEHIKKESGIFSFLEEWLSRIATDKCFTMVTPSEAIATIPAEGRLSSPQFTSWADHERDLSAWQGNDMQREAFYTMMALEPEVDGFPDLKAAWRYLQTSDHFYYMSTKQNSDGSVHAYFSPYPSPHEAFINYMNVLADLEMSLKKRQVEKQKHATFEMADENLMWI